MLKKKAQEAEKRLGQDGIGRSYVRMRYLVWHAGRRGPVSTAILSESSRWKNQAEGDL